MADDKKHEALALVFPFRIEIGGYLKHEVADYLLRRNIGFTYMPGPGLRVTFRTDERGYEILSHIGLI